MYDYNVSVVGPLLIDESPKTECETEEKPDSKTNEQNYLSELLKELEVVSGMEMKFDDLRDSNEKLKNALEATEHHSKDLQMVVQYLNEHAENLDLMLSDKDFEIDILERQMEELLNKLKGLETDYHHVVTENTKLLGVME
ncbi:hypothetical protein ACOME3_002741 [Neoechinorhynchus agilis]